MLAGRADQGPVVRSVSVPSAGHITVIIETLCDSFGSYASRPMKVE